MKRKGEQFDDVLGNPADVPAEFGTTPIPEGHARFSHYTDPEALSGIKEHGLLRSKARQDYEPEIFMSSGAPSADMLATKPVVEGHVHPASDLNVGDTASAEHLASRNLTITARGDIPASQILAIHEPWHQTYRHAMEDEGTRRRVLAGQFDNLWKDDQSERGQTFRKGFNAAKTATIAKIMLGGGV